MKNILIIIAHPNKESLNFSIANTVKEQKELAGYDVKILDLYSDNKQDFFSFTDQHKIKNNNLTDYHQELITWANKMIFVFPYWWGSEPAILHNWIDSNFLSNYAFKYVNNRPQGMLQGKTVTVYTTSGTPSFMYFFTGGYRWLKKRWKKGIVEFCGMKLDGFYTFGWVDTSKSKAEKILKKVKKLNL